MNGKASRIDEAELRRLADLVIRILELSCDLVHAWALEPAGGSLELMLVVWALLVAEGEGRPMAVSRLADYTGIPRATLYRRLTRLHGTRVVSLDASGYFRLSPEFVRSGALRSCVQAIATRIRIFGAVLEGRNGSDPAEGRSAVSAFGPFCPAVRADGVAIGRLVMDIVWRTGEGQEKWAGAACDLALLRWLVLQAELEGQVVTMNDIALRARLPLATCYRKIRRLIERSLVIRDADGRLTTAWPFLRGTQEDAGLPALRNHIGKVVEAVLRMDSNTGE